MSPPAWAYQVENFVPAPDEELICSICQNVFCDPVQSPCDHVYCRTCISKWLENNRNCPICRKRTTRSSLREVVPIVKNMILKLNLRCHNIERGCNETFTLEGCDSHVKNCTFELIQCKNKPCRQMLMRKDMKSHETLNCPHSYVRCNVCRLKISSRSTAEHNCVEDLRKKLKEKSDKLKKNYQKIKKLKEELKNLRENDDSSSDSSSMVFSTLDESSHNSSQRLVTDQAWFDFDENTGVSSIITSSYFTDSADDDVDDDSMWSRITPAQQERNQRRIIYQVRNFLRNSDQPASVQNSSSSSPSNQSSNNTSIEYARASSPVSRDDSSVLIIEPSDPIVEEEDEPQQIRRPAKRRMNTRVLSSSSDEAQKDDVDHTYPSRKRTWPLSSANYRTGNSSGEASNAVGAVPGPSFLSSPADSSTSNDSSLSNTRSQFRLRPKNQSRSADQLSTVASLAATSPTPVVQQYGSPVFERTISLLEQYNLESDPEWLPPQNVEDLDDSENDPPYILPGHITSSDESSISDLDDSESSCEDTIEKTEDLLRSLYGSDSSADWYP